MEQVPLVMTELGPMTAGFRDAARELGAARQVVADVGPGDLGTPECSAAVEQALRDLAVVLERLEAAAAGCVQVLGRYGAVSDS